MVFDATRKPLRQVHVLENLTWGPVAAFELQSRIPASTVSRDDKLQTFREHGLADHLAGAT